MNLSPHREAGSRWSIVNQLDQTLSGTDGIRLLADFPTAFGMNNYLYAWMALPNRFHVLREKTLVDRAVAFPQNDFRFAKSFRRGAAHEHERIPDHAFIQRNTHGKCRVATEMLTRREEDGAIAL